MRLALDKMRSDRFQYAFSQIQAECIYLAFNGKIDEAQAFADKMLKSYPPYSKEKLQNKILQFGKEACS
jgi:hypothetical protein